MQNKEYIEREAVVEKSTYMFDEVLGHCKCVLVEDVEKIPSANVVEVKSGEWIVDEEKLKATCSVCGKTLNFSDKMQISMLKDNENFCYFCGTDMRPNRRRNDSWISVKDKLPKVGERVLVYCDKEKSNYGIGLYSDTYRTFFVSGFSCEGITHWQPLPEPPVVIENSIDNVKPLYELHREMYSQFRQELNRFAIPLLFDDEDFKCQNILCDDKIVGIFCTEDNYIDCIYIQPEYRRRGLAKEVVLSYIQKEGVGKTLHIINNNEVAKSFWNSLFELRELAYNDVDALYEIVSIKGGAE